MKRKLFKTALTFICVAVIILSLGMTVFAEDTAIKEAESSVEVEDVKVADGDEKNPFSELYGRFVENSDTVFSLLSLIGTAIIALLYRKGLIPGLKNAVGSFTEALTSIKKETEKTSGDTAKYGDKLTALSCGLDSALQQLSELSAKLDSESAHKESQLFNTIIIEQIELLYDVFMSSSLPEYKKEEVGVRIGRMKEALRNEASTEQ